MQLGTLQDVYAHPGPYVTVHLDVSRTTETGRQEVESRWNNARRTLESEGVAAEVIEEIGNRVLDPVDMPGEVRRTIIAAGDEILFDDVLAGHSVWPEVVACGDLPDVSGWLHQADGQMPFLLVVADREGADLDFHRAMMRSDTEHSQVEGDTQNLHHFKGGGWSHQRFQERTENQAAANAREVADEITRVVRRHRPRVVILAGVQQARTEIVAALDSLPCEVVEIEAGGRGDGSSEEAMWEEIEQVLARIEAEDQQQLTGRLEEKWGRGSGAALGVDDVMEALVQRKVDTLIVDLQKAHDISVDPSKYPGLPIPAQLATKKELPADQVLVAAGAATDTNIAVLPAEQSKGGGIAALGRVTRERSTTMTGAFPRLAVVTGADSGIGKATAELLAAEGFDVGITFHTDESGVEDTRAAVAERGQRCFVAHQELASPDAADVVDELVGRLGGLGVLVNNAGTGHNDPALDLPYDTWREVLATDLDGPFLCAQRAARHLKENGNGGRIVNVTSVHEHVPRVGSVAYCAAKAGLGMITKVLALELAEHGILVNSVAPGEIATPMTGKGEEEAYHEERPGNPVGRPGHVNEVASVIAFLASPRSSYVTGSSFTVDGGLTLMAAHGHDQADGSWRKA